MRLPVPYVAMEVQAQRDKYRVLIDKVLSVVREYNAIIAAAATDRRLFTDRLRHIDRRVGSGVTKLTWNMDRAALDFYQREARRYCREGTASVARFKAGVARVHAACGRAAELALIDLSRKGVVQYSEFAETQRMRAQAADAALQEIAAEVAGVKDSLYEIFAADGAEVRPPLVQCWTPRKCCGAPRSLPAEAGCRCRLQSCMVSSPRIADAASLMCSSTCPLAALDWCVMAGCTYLGIRVQTE